MGMNYGSNFDLPELDTSELSFITARPAQGLISFFRTLITIGQIGVSLIPGIDVIAEIGLGLTAGAINETLDVVQGNANLASAFINFGTPLIAGASVAKLNTKLAQQVTEGAADAIEAVTALAKEGFETDAQLASLVKTGLVSSTEEAAEFLEVADITTKSKIPYKTSRRKGLRALENRILNESESDITRTQARKVLRSLQRGRAQLNSLTDSIAFESKQQRRILKIIGFPDAAISDALAIINKASFTPQDRYSAFLGFIRDFDISDQVANSYAFRSLRTAIRRGDLTVNSTLQLPLAQQYNRLVERNAPIFGVKQTSVAEVQRKSANSFFNKYIRALRNPGSREFNDLIVQPLQAAFDANDAGRAPIEALYRVLKKSVKNSLASIKKVATKAIELEDLFTKTGGVLVDSDVILGYKIILDSKVPGGQLMVQISFKPEVTDNKAPVIVFTSKKQLRRFKNSGSPMNYYLDHWAFSRGGKALGLDTLFANGLKVKGLSKVGRTALSFLPINALRNILSITSNVVENIYSMSQGTYTNTWKTKFEGSFKRSAINRTFRLVTKEVIGGSVGALFGKQFGAFLGRELQRIGTNVLAPLTRNAAAGKPLTSGLTKANLANQFATGVKSNLRRVLRAQRGNNSVIIQQLSTQRKIQQINRIPNAVVPGRPYRGIQLQKK